MPNSSQKSWQHASHAAIAKGNGTMLRMRYLFCSTRTRIFRRRSVEASDWSKQLRDSNGVYLLYSISAQVAGLEFGGLWVIRISVRKRYAGSSCEGNLGFAVLILLVITRCNSCRAFLNIEHKSKCGITIQVIPVQTLTPEEA